MSTGRVQYKLWLVTEQAGVHYKDDATHSDENAGFDLFTAEDYTDSNLAGVYLLNLGVRAMMTRLDTGEAVHYWLAPRSSIFKTGYMMANSVGIIDKSYRGILKAPVVRVTTGPGFKSGDRHFQIVAPDMGHIAEVACVDELPSTQRGDGGFGSTGR